MNADHQAKLAAKDGRYARLFGLRGPTGVIEPCSDCKPGCACRQVDPPASLLRMFDHNNLYPGFPGIRFNGSILDYSPGYLLAYRDAWNDADIWLGKLSPELEPLGEPWMLSIEHPQATAGREDPRLFRLGDRIGVIFAGLTTSPRHTDSLLAWLDNNLEVASVHAPHYPGRNSWEKNWSPFAPYYATRTGHAHLSVVYHAQPHRILSILPGAWDAAPLVHSERGLEVWEGGEIRGGAPPVRVGEEFWHFFHDRIHTGTRYVYRMGLYTFDVEPPHAPKRLCRKPLLVADPRTRLDDGPAVVFPGGALRRGSDWLVCVGVHDAHIELHRFDHKTLDSLLEPL